MSTEIGQLRLTLPPGFERRAHRIGRLVGEALAERTLPAGRLPRVNVGPLKLDARRSNHAIASDLARHIHLAIERQTRNH
ncbi:MAG: hypothetical protein H7A46_22055 [Verrucomicrobiales bacterium]|nr:hypothetical protein [Verrucomicrobiales bacterium]